MTTTDTPPTPGDAGNGSPVGRVVTASLERVRLPKKRSGHVLLMLSGGLDSVALLANLLSATDLEVHAHHIVLDNREQRAEAESGVLEPILDTCRDRYRPFETSESVHGFHLPGGGWDTMVTMFTAARASRALGKWPVDVVVTGHINPSFKELAEGESVFHAAHQSRRWRPEWVRPLAWLRGHPATQRSESAESCEMRIPRIKPRPLPGCARFPPLAKVRCPRVTHPSPEGDAAPTGR